ncbi:MAG: aminotransferase class IV [Leptospiraceae bacterium]|nr:aminotransferase class IV [Leptospiraceae bacterium]MCK6381643.1 aminotransferase class IV [Leptospiraceae bacterium]NUM41087.1 aminotransferase class IV [Leptospiraceae bacterium]
MSDFLIINGKKLQSESAFISAVDSGFTYGFAIYETFFIKDSRVAFFNEHVERMRKSIEYFQIRIENDFTEKIKSQTKELIHSNQIKNGRMRLTLSPGVWSLPDLKSNSVTTVLSASPILHTNTSIQLMVSSFRKTNEVFLPDFVKVTGNFPSIFSYKEAKENGFDEAVLLRKDGIVTEGSFCNLFWIDEKDRIKTPSLDSCILGGVTRSEILKAAESIGIKIIEGKFSQNELKSCKLIYISSSTRGLLRVSQLDKRIFPEIQPDSILNIQKEYEKRESESLKLFSD